MSPAWNSLADLQLILTRDVREYRQTVQEVVASTDLVLEVGCATGTTSQLIGKHAQYVLAIDQSARVLEARDKGLSNVRFERWNAWSIDQIREVSTSFDKIYVDISGSAPPDIVLRLTRAYVATFRPRIVVVKNGRLKDFVAHSRVWPK